MTRINAGVGYEDNSSKLRFNAHGSVSLIRLERKIHPFFMHARKGKETKEIDKPGTAENHTRSSQIPLVIG